MNQDFIIGKFREIRGFWHILKGRIKRDDRERIAGSEQALRALDIEKHAYQQEIAEAKKHLHEELHEEQEFVTPPFEKVMRESGPSEQRDISAI